MIVKTLKYYLQRKKIVPTPIRSPKYETGTLRSHSRPVDGIGGVNPILRTPESPGTKVTTEAHP